MKVRTLLVKAKVDHEIRKKKTSNLNKKTKLKTNKIIRFYMVLRWKVYFKNM